MLMTNSCKFHICTGIKVSLLATQIVFAPKKKLRVPLNIVDYLKFWTWISKHVIHFPWDVFTLPYPNSNDCLTDPSLKLQYA